MCSGLVIILLFRLIISVCIYWVSKTQGIVCVSNTKARSTLTTIVAEFGDYSRQCGQGLSVGVALTNYVYGWYFNNSV